MLKGWLSDLKKLLFNKNMLSAFLLLTIMGFIFGYYVTDIIDKRKDYKDMDIEKKQIESYTLDDKNNQLENVPANSQKGDVKVTKNTRLIFEREYLKINEIDKEITYPENEVIGFDEKQLKDYYKQWEMVVFDENEVIFRKKIDSYSPKYYKIGIGEKNGQEYIAVFNYQKEGEELLYYLSDTPISILSEREKEKLKQGILYSDIEEVYRMLENYDG